MRPTWRAAVTVSEMFARADGSIVAVDTSDCYAVDADGRERWRVHFDRLPGDLAPCAGGCVLSLYQRDAPSVVVVLDDDGRERWRHSGDWFLNRHGLSARDHRVVAVASRPDRVELRMVLDARSGAVVRHDQRTGGEWPPVTITGHGWVAQLDSGEQGLACIDPASGEERVLTTRSHVGLAVADDLAYIDTTGYESPSSVIAVDLASGAERWSRPGGPNMTLGLGGDRLGFVAETGGGLRPTVVDRHTGESVWTGDPVAPLPDDHYFDCLVSQRAVVLFGSFEYHAVYGYDAPGPVSLREQLPVSHRSALLDGARYLEAGRDGLTCWQVP